MMATMTMMATAALTALLVVGPFGSLGMPELLGSISLGAQGRTRPRAPERDPMASPGIAPGEIQRLFDAYIVMQAQQALSLTDDQFPRFLTRVRTLQEARRRGQVERSRRLQRLRQLSNAPAAGQDEAIRTELKELAALDDRTSTEIREAVNGIDEVLDLRQQARFRLFEEQIERRKVELLMRSRQLNRPRAQPQP
jgi:hypothetical protein